MFKIPKTAQGNISDDVFQKECTSLFRLVIVCELSPHLAQRATGAEVFLNHAVCEWICNNFAKLNE